MATIILGAVGSAMGSAVAGTVGAAVGTMVGRMVGTSVDNAIFGGGKLADREGPRLANSVSSSEQSQSHSSSNAFSAGDDIQLTISSNSSCADLSFTIKYTRTLS